MKTVAVICEHINQYKVFLDNNHDHSVRYVRVSKVNHVRGIVFDDIVLLSDVRTVDGWLSDIVKARMK